MILLDYAVLFVAGLCFGSFFNALAWRLHSGQDMLRDRSRCEYCNHLLAPKDLVPVASWLMLKGKCRYCKARLSWHHPSIELLVGLLFVLSFAAWPYSDATIPVMVLLGIWLLMVGFYVSLAIYDLRWMLLPDVITLPLIAVGVVGGLVRFVWIEDLGVMPALLEVLLGVLALSGTYWLLHRVSGGRWVGFGDVKLTASMGAMLGWRQAVVALMAANIVGVLVILPGLVTGKLKRTSRLPFGPFLIAGFVVAGLLGDDLIDILMNL